MSRIGVRRAAPADLDELAVLFDPYRVFQVQASDPVAARGWTQNAQFHMFHRFAG